MTLSADDRTLTTTYPCGGTFEAVEAPTWVSVTLTASGIGIGALMCADVPLTAPLDAPLGGRQLLDAETGKVLTVTQR